MSAFSGDTLVFIQNEAGSSGGGLFISSPISVSLQELYFEVGRRAPRPPCVRALVVNWCAW